ncbi:2',5'-phosphodiesterase 12 [Phodopus roborovskii]|uniref:2',5'-phosphodiesterase 12 n=1 Tax=Phodopus roborovskii TaxID=109678 RepID=A0AAU9YUC0_PHORO|nr:2',5'-phosphodiesterase 12 [Phodopus roborovskii]CAH6778946.1 Pde12 [Phodopus roborovskii]
MWRLPGRVALRGVRPVVQRCGRAGAATDEAARAMERAVVRCVPSEPKLSLSFALADGSHKNMQRDQSEPLGRALSRIATNALKGHAKAAAAKKHRKDRARSGGGAACAAAGPEAAAAGEPVVKLYYREEAVADDVLNVDAWQDGAVLQIGDVKYKVERNPPAFTELQLPRYIMAGFPVCPKLSVEFGDAASSVFRWYKEVRPGASEPGHGGLTAAAASHSLPPSSWTDTGVGERVYTPCNADVGLRLKLHCTPGNGQRFGPSRELESVSPVEAGPGTCTFDHRHLYTKKVTEDSFIRTVSYNILADTYAQTEFSRTVLYPYCAPYALELDYRQNLIQKELAGYNADILCLQEVDRAVFTDSLVPALDAFGLAGVFRIKQHEGLATFYRKSKFSLLSQHDISFQEALESDPLHKELLEKLALNPLAQEKVLQRSSVLQISVLQSTKDSSKKICVANTHLYWHPKGGYIRLIQMAIALVHIRHVSCDLYPGIPVIFCGDFNSTPSTGMYHFVINGSITEDHEDWASNGEEERCSMSLTHLFKLKSACGEPAYTNYVGGFHGCLDYIFIDLNALEVEQVIPLPSHEEVTTHQALPSVSHPSDHIALVCDLKWK